jgi:phosphatidate cytidylyltransferase
MLTRVLSAVVLAPPFLYCVYRGHVWFLGLMLGLSLLGLKEYFDLLAAKSFSNQRVLGYLWIAAIYGAIWQAGTNGMLAMLALFPNLFIVKFLKLVSTPSIEGAAMENAHTFYGVLGYGVPLAFLVLIRDMDPRGISLLLLVVLIWVQDIAAYFWGMAIGRHKFQPQLSPKKTWEGAVLGLATALAAVLGCMHYFDYPISSRFILGLALTAVAAQLGDLNESLLKRNMEAKDSGTLIPGHGGVLDRFDSFTFAAPVMYYVFQITR